MKKSVKWVLPLAVAGALVVPASPVYAAQDSVKQLKQTIKKLKKSNKKLDKKLDKANDARDALSDENGALRSRNGSLTSANGSLKGRITDLEQELRAAKPAGQTGVRGEGVWRMRLDIAPGTWRTAGSTDGYGCYWERLSDLSGELDAIIANGVGDGPMVVTFQSSDAAAGFSGDCVWTKVS